MSSLVWGIQTEEWEDVISALLELKEEPDVSMKYNVAE